SLLRFERQQHELQTDSVAYSCVNQPSTSVTRSTISLTSPQEVHARTCRKRSSLLSWKRIVSSLSANNRPARIFPPQLLHDILLSIALEAASTSPSSSSSSSSGLSKGTLRFVSSCSANSMASRR